MNREDWVHIDTYWRDIELLKERIDELEEVVESYEEDIQFMEDQYKKLVEQIEGKGYDAKPVH